MDIVVTIPKSRRDPKVHEIKPIEMNGFRGFRYFSGEEERKR